MGAIGAWRVFVVVAAAHDAPRGQKKGDVGVAETIPHEHISKPMGVFDEVVDYVNVPLPQVVEEVEVAQISAERIMEHIAFKVPQEHGQERIAVQRVNIKAPPVMEETVTGVLLTPQQRDQERIATQSVYIPVPLAMEKSGRSTQGIPQERVHNRTLNQHVHSPVPQLAAKIVELSQQVLQERTQTRIREQIVDLPVPQLATKIAETILLALRELTRGKHESGTTLWKSQCHTSWRKSVDCLGANASDFERHGRGGHSGPF